MESFSTRIVKTWSPSPLLRGIMIVFLMGGGAILYVFDVQEHWVRISASVVYFVSMFGAFSLSFFKPKNLGELKISRSNIEVLLKDSSENWPISEIRDIRLYDPAEEGFWEKITKARKKKIYFSTSSDENRNYEIVLQSNYKQEELKKFLRELNQDRESLK